MKTNKLFALITILVVSLLCGCGKQSQSEADSEEIKAFRTAIDTFSTNITEIDAAINSIDFSNVTYRNELTGKLNELNTLFTDFANVDFPEDFNYLEHLADEAAEYMSKAVSSYSEIFSNDSLDPESISILTEDADTNYANAFKRIKVIMTFLNGEVSQDANLSGTDQGTLTQGE